MWSQEQIGSCPLHTPYPSRGGPLYARRLLIALGFLKENDYYCQNQTMKAANDVWLRTTTLLPVAYELNEPTGGSQDRKSKQNERRKYVHKQTSQRERGKQLENWHQKFSCWNLSNSRTVLYVLSCVTSLSLAAQTTDRIWDGTCMLQNMWPHLFVFASRDCGTLWPYLWTCVLCSSCLSTLAFITLLGDIASFSIFPQIRQMPPCSEIWHKDLKIPKSSLPLWSSCYLFGSLNGIIVQQHCE